jgi:hypothetical protein
MHRWGALAESGIIRPSTDHLPPLTRTGSVPV